MFKLVDKSKSAGAGVQCREASQEVIVTTAVEVIVEAAGKTWEIKTATPASTTTMYENTKGDMWVDFSGRRSST